MTVEVLLKELTFLDLPDEILEKIIDGCDEHSMVSLCLTCRRFYGILKNDEKRLFEIAKKKVSQKLSVLGLKHHFKSLEEIENFQELQSKEGSVVQYGMSSLGYKHTFESLNRVIKLKNKGFFDVQTVHIPHNHCILQIMMLSGLFFLAWSCVCLGQANDIYEQQHRKGNDAHALSFSLSLSSLYSSSSLLFLHPDFMSENENDRNIGSVSGWGPGTLKENGNENENVNENETENAERKEKKTGKENRRAKKTEEVKPPLQTLFHKMAMEKEKERGHEKENGNEKKKEISVDGEKDEGEEKGKRGGAHSIFFLWHFTTAAVCIFLSVLVFALFYYYMNRDNLVWLVLLVVVLLMVTVFPALRMDGFIAVSYYFLFIPASLIVLVFLVLSVVLCCFPYWVYRLPMPRPYPIACPRFGRRTFCCVFGTGFPVAALLVAAGYVLVVLNLEGEMSGAWPYSLLLLLPTAGVLFIQAVWKCRFGCSFSFWFVLAPVIFGGFVLPFCLRIDGLFHTSYHFVFIPIYISIFVVEIVFVCYGCLIAIANSIRSNDDHDDDDNGNDLEKQHEKMDWIWCRLCLVLEGKL